MKQKDIALIVVVAIVAGVISVFASRFIFASGTDRQQKAEVVDAVSTDFIKPSDKYFNANSIDPTRLIEIGESNNQNPFASQSQ